VGFAERFRTTNRWLDCGYGEGGLLAIAEQRGWNCYGIEVSPVVLEYGRERGWVVASEPAGDLGFTRGGFDVVTMIEFLEHVANPGDFLNDAARWLRSGGLLYLTTPNVRSLNARILRLSWSVVSPPEHLVLWTVPALLSVLTKAGFQVLRVRSEGFNPSETLGTVQRWRGVEAPVDRNRSAAAMSEALARTTMSRALKNSINRGLSVLRLGDTLKIWARRVG
jgi:SAM-dependent methyltransferase